MVQFVELLKEKLVSLLLQGHCVPTTPTVIITYACVPKTSFQRSLEANIAVPPMIGPAVILFENVMKKLVSIAYRRLHHNHSQPFVGAPTTSLVAILNG
jgi:hypothetical protein